MEEPQINGAMDPPSIAVAKPKQPDITSPGPKFLVISRTDGSKTLINVSPFLIKRVVDNTCGEVAECKKLRNGTILVKTKNLNQAKKLIELKNLSPNIDIAVSWHNSLNYAKGVIYSNDLRGIPEDEILNELKHQKVIKVEKIKRKVNDVVEETGLVIVSFESSTLPAELNIGYERVKIRTYVPLPLRCKECLRYGHIAKICKNSKICPNCSLNYHTEENEICMEPKTCSNCKEFDLLDCNHSALDKKCPIFLQEREIQSIVSLEKVNKKTAYSFYKQRHPNTTLFSSVAKQTTNNSQSLNSEDNKKGTDNPIITTSLKNSGQQNSLPSCSHHSTSNQRSVTNYANISDFEISEHEMQQLNTQTQQTTEKLSNYASEIETSENEIDTTQKSIKNNDLIILPRKTSNRNKKKLNQQNISGQISKRTKK